MLKYTVEFVDQGLRIEVESERTLFQAMLDASIAVDAPCGGRGKCGKCLVEIRNPQAEEWMQVRACQTKVNSDLLVRNVRRSDDLNVLLEGGAGAQCPWKSWVYALHVQVEPCPKGESSSDWRRLAQALQAQTGLTGWKIRPERAGALCAQLREGGGSIWAVVNGAMEVVDVQLSEPQMYMLAVDLGTTSIAGYLLDVNRQCTVASAGEINPQIQYGADVVSRVSYALEQGGRALAESARRAVDALAQRLCAQAGARREQVYAAALVGNTGMHHLFLNIRPEALAHAPYNPALDEGLILRAEDYGLHLNAQAALVVLPVIAGYVGADTVACLLSGDWLQRERCTLLVDIGTNGEMVLGNRHRRIACSTAAGPAFEGARIQCGMRGVEGAVDRVWLEGETIRYHVIGDVQAKGICGSGLVDLIATLLEAGELDESGRLTHGDAYALGEGKVVLTQQDVREVQLAKAAVRAGIELLAQRMGMALEEIEEVHIAGAFGNYLNPDSACAIGLIPPVLRKKIVKVGNAAGEGAKRALQDRDAWETARRLARETEFLELASLRQFQDTFVDALEFEDEEGEGEE